MTYSYPFTPTECVVYEDPVSNTITISFLVDQTQQECIDELSEQGITGYAKTVASLPDIWFNDCWSLSNTGDISVDLQAVREVALSYTRRHAARILEKIRVRELTEGPVVNTVSNDLTTFTNSVSAATNDTDVVTAMNTFHNTIGMNWKTGEPLNGSTFTY